MSKLGLRNQHLAINGAFRASLREDVYAMAWERQAQRAIDGMPAGLRSLSRSFVPLAAKSPLGIAALRSLGCDATEHDEPVASVNNDSSPPPIGQYIEEIASQGHGLILTMGKGGVGKTTLAAAIAVALADRGCRVHLSTTDPAAHVEATLSDHVSQVLTVSCINPQVETARYAAEVMKSVGTSLDAAGKALLAEDLRSPCTEEIAVFRAFAATVAQAGEQFVVMDTAPTGHTILLLDAAQAYHREVTRQSSQVPKSVRHLLPRLRDRDYSRVFIVTLAEATPVHEAAALQQDLRRAGIEPYAWVVNQSLATVPTRDPGLVIRQQQEFQYIAEVQARYASRVALIPWQTEPLVGYVALQHLTNGHKCANAVESGHTSKGRAS